MIKKIKKLNPTGMICLAISIILIIALVYTTITYAYWQKKYEQQSTNTIKSGCFSLTFNDENSQSIYIPKAYPISEDEATSGEYYEFTITNTCSIDMYYNVTLNTTGNSDLDNFIDYKLIDESGKEIGPKIVGSLDQYTDYNGKEYSDENGSYNILTSYILTSGKLDKAIMNDDNSEILTQGESKTYKLYLWIDEGVDDVNTMNKRFEGKIIITSTTQEKSIATYRCKRATELHNDGTNTYGTISASGLNAGDAFVCDVSGDGKYDETNEMFYYVSDYYDTDLKAFNSKVATLIYYNNTVEGAPNNTGSIAYNSDNVNNLGPTTAVANLPTTTQWKTRLYKTTRQILNENSDTTTTAGDITSFDYSAYAARLLTYQELKSACPNVSTAVDSLDDCTYLMENTYYQNSSLKYGYWLETPRASDVYHVWDLSGGNRYVSYNQADYSVQYGVRPAIDVLKSDIIY